MLSKPAILKGLDVRSNLLGKDPDRASDCMNVSLNPADELRNRPFFTSYTFPASTFLGSIKGFQNAYFNSYNGGTKSGKEEVILAFASGQNASGAGTNYRGKVLKMVGTTSTNPLTKGTKLSAPSDFTAHECQYDDTAHTAYAPFTAKDPVKSVSTQGVSYFLAKYGLWKFDGLYGQRAGCPKPTGSISGSTPSTLNYWRVFFARIDFSGGWVFGDYDELNSTYSLLQYDMTASGPPLTQDKLIDGLWDNRGFWFTATSYNAGASEFTFTVASTMRHLLVGDYITLYGQPMGISGYHNVIVKVKVKTITSTTVVLDTSDAFLIDLSDGAGFISGLGSVHTGFWAALDLKSSGPVSNILLVSYNSLSATTGFKFSDVSCVANPTMTTSWVELDWGVGSSITSELDNYPFTHAFENCYDESKVKGNLPVNTGATNKTDFFGLAIFNNLLLAITQERVYYSDTSLGSNMENFDPRDFFIPGEDEDGPITGIFANTEYVVIHREKNSYYLTGNIVTGSFKVKDLNLDEVGGLYHTGQVSILGQNFFVSKKGAHAISSGGTFTDLGLLVEPIFKNELASFGSFPRTAANLPLVNCLIDTTKNHIYVIYQNASGTTSLVLVYNYRVKEWFVWRIPQAFVVSSGHLIGGAAVLSGALWVSEGTTTFWKENTSDSSPDASFTSSPALWTSVFRDEGLPSTEKRYTYLKLFSLQNSVGSTFDVDTQYDWETAGFTDQGDDITLPNTEVSPSQGFRLLGITDRNCYSFQWKVTSTSYLKIQGYQLEVHKSQEEVNR